MWQAIAARVMRFVALSAVTCLLSATATATAQVGVSSTSEVPPPATLTTNYPATGAQTSTLTIYSSTDTTIFQAIVREFQRLNPGVAVIYEELDGAPLYDRFLRESAANTPRADLLLSSSMDLQVKLVNDGHAASHTSANARALPAWARWRDQAFGFTFEPAVMVFNREAMRGMAIPQSRGELVELIRRDHARWTRRIGTYDIVNASVGYLLASQDARQSSEFGALIEAFGDTDARVDISTGSLLDLIASGELAIGYNLLGSYAQRRVEQGAPIVVVYPRDYTLAVARTAVLAANAPNPDAAHRFLEFLLSIAGQELLASHSRLPAVRQEVASRYSRLGIIEAQVGPLRPIALGPGLLVYLDKQKRERLLGNWTSTMERATP